MEDTQPNAELVTALEAALEILRELGAIVEDVRVRSLHDYYSVRVMLTESELFARHQYRLRRHASEYGHHFLGRTLAAALFSGADYLAAQRERRRIIAEMQPLYAKYDAFITTGAGPAPHLNAHRSIGAAQKWTTPSMGTMLSVTGRARAGGSLRVLEERLAARHADRRPAVRRRDTPRDRACVRAGYALVRAAPHADAACSTRAR